MSDFKTLFLRHLEEIAFFLEYNGENVFRIRAFEKAREGLNALDSNEIETRVTSETLIELDGIGKGIASIAKSFQKIGSSEEWKVARKNLPTSMVDLTQISGLGPKKIRVLYEELQISSLGELEYACNENRLVDLKGFGEKTQAKFLEAIMEIKMRRGKFILADALVQAEAFEAKFPKDIKWRRVGPLGRYLEIIESFDYLIETEGADTLKKLKGLKEVSKQKSFTEFQSAAGLCVRIYWASRLEAPIRAIFLSSSEAHWKSLERAADKKEFKLSETALTKNSKPQNISDEKEFYKLLGLSFCESFERELEVQPNKSINTCRLDDLTGVFHLHTTASDGNNSLEEMAEAARSHGWHFMGLSDHSQTAFYAGGLDEARLKKQWSEVEALNKKYKDFKILRGVESDILKDGSLDYPASFLKQLDFVIASIHTRYGMTEMTERILNAIENPETTIVGHLTGRLLLAREGYQVDHKKIIDAAIKHRKVIELNSHPNRLDIDWRYLSEACKKGLIISINPDAHSVAGLDHVKYGVWLSRKAGVPKENILNTWPLKKITEFLGLEN